MDLPVVLFLIMLMALSFAVALYTMPKAGKSPKYLLAFMLSIAFGLFIAFGFYVQCDNVVIFYRCR